jgi:hypothetical protein
MTKTNNNRVRAKARKSPKSLRDLNTAKMNAVMSKFIPAVYDLHVEFTLTNDQDLNDPLDFLPRNLSQLEAGSGYCMMTGQRDFHFRGTEVEMKNIMRQFCSSPFKVVKFYVYPDGDHFNEFNDNVRRQAFARAERRAKAKRAKR